MRRIEQNDERQLPRCYMALEPLRALADNQLACLSTLVRQARARPNQNSRLVHHYRGHDLQSKSFIEMFGLELDGEGYDGI
jgi:hypothetical protein